MSWAKHTTEIEHIRGVCADQGRATIEWYKQTILDALGHIEQTEELLREIGNAENHTKSDGHRWMMQVDPFADGCGEDCIPCRIARLVPKPTKDGG